MRFRSPHPADCVLLACSVARLRVLAGCALCALAVAGCGAIPVGTLSRVIVAGTPVNRSDTLQQVVEVVRIGGPIAPSVGMTLQKGDTIRTGPDTKAVLTLANVWRLTLEENGSVYVVNPRAWLTRGKLWVKSVATAVREALTVESEHVLWAAEGTEFLLEAHGDSITVSVLEGVVTASPREQGRWEPVRFGALQRGRTNGPEQLDSLPPLTEAEADSLRQELDRIEELLLVRVPDFRNMDQDEVQAQLSATSLRSGGINQVVTGQTEPGRVVSHSPGPGETVMAGTYVNFDYEVSSANVPSLGGMTLAEATQALEGAGLSVGDVEEVETAEYPDGTVIDQSPDETRRARTGTRVALTMARTPEGGTISGRVTVANIPPVEGVMPLAGVTVTLSGNVSVSTTTDAAGQYSFVGLPAGTYTVTISGFDPSAYVFAVTSQSTSVTAGATASVSFNGDQVAEDMFSDGSVTKTLRPAHGFGRT